MNDRSPRLRGELYMGSVYLRKWTTSDGVKREAWCIAYSGPDGKRVREGTTATCKKDALFCLEERQVKVMEARKAGRTTTDTVTFADFVEKKYIPFITTHKRPSWVATSKARLLIFTRLWGHLPISEVLGERIENWKLDRANETSARTKRGIAKITINNDLALLASVFTKAVKLGVISVSPMLTVERFQRCKNVKSRIVTPEEEVRLIDSAGETDFALAIRLALVTGLRSAELFGLEWRDVDLAKRQIHIRAETAKGGKTATLPVSQKALTVLSEAHSRRSVTSPFVFRAYHGGPYSAPWMNMARISRKAGLPDVTLHTLRHTFGTRLAKAGVRMSLLKTLMRHESLETTTIYITDEDGEDLAGAVALI